MSKHAAPQGQYFEDVLVGQKAAYGTCTLSEAEILDFAHEFDPQPIHTDAEAAAQTLYGGLIASGWQTAALVIRMVVERMGTEGRGGFLASPGFEELRWLRPVRPGDTLALSSEVVAVRASRSKPDRGIVTTIYTMTNQSGDTVLTLRSFGLYRRRNVDGT